MIYAQFVYRCADFLAAEVPEGDIECRNGFPAEARRKSVRPDVYNVDSGCLRAHLYKMWLSVTAVS